jgi:hypothetical protein
LGLAYLGIVAISRGGTMLRSKLFLGAGCLAATLAASSLGAQDTTANADSIRVARILAFRDSLSKQSKTLRLGLSVGWRHILKSTGSLRRDAVVDPQTKNVSVDSVDQGDVVLSGVMTAFPWQRSDHWIAPLGFLANINLASFGSEGLSTFNKSIEGGGGLAWKFSDDFALGLTLERVFSRTLRSWVEVGKPIVIDDKTVESISKDDGRFFRDDNFSALSIKFLYFLN